jgi:cell division protein FtsQ
MPIGTRRSVIRKRTRSTIMMNWLRRFGLVLIGGVAIAWVGAWFFMSGAFTRSAEWTQNKTLAITVDMGFTVENILVEGRANADPEVILGLVGLEKGDPLFALDLAETQKKMEQVTWVKHARIERRLPDTVYIGLQEHTPLALWQKDKKLSLLAEDGSIISTENLARFGDLVIVIGEDAPAQAPALLADLAAEQSLLNRIRAASWVGERRWDLTLKSGAVVKLPEADMGLALRRLGQAQEEDKLLDKDVTSIDLREPGRIVVSPRAGAAQEYKAGLKAGNNI